MKSFVKCLFCCVIFAMISVVMVGCAKPDKNTINQLFIDTSNATIVFDIVDDFNSSGVAVTGKDKEGNYHKLEGFNIDYSNFVKGQVGTYSIKVYYEDISEYYNVEVKDKGVLEITKNSTFAIGQPFENNSPEITHINSSGQAALVNEYNVLSFNPVSVGTHTAVISAFGFNYDVEFSVVENHNFFESLVYNTLVQTEHDQVKFAEFYWWNSSIGGVDPDEHHIYACSSDYIYRYSAMYERKGWAMADGLAIMQDSNDVVTSQQCDNQQDALELVTNFTCSSFDGYESYMEFVEDAETLMQIDGLDYTLNCVQEDTIVNITVVIENYRYEVSFNTLVGIFEEAKVYESDFMINHYIFSSNLNYVNYAPPAVA